MIYWSIIINKNLEYSKLKIKKIDYDQILLIK